MFEKRHFDPSSKTRIFRLGPLSFRRLTLFNNWLAEGTHFLADVLHW